ncbi:MAG: ribulose-phosphate 3-epimerase [Ichthyobacteriaceae bacterium]|nr:ribulose-phosphate 3-epimerase [Ichthyobacteriaceae bacterium]
MENRIISPSLLAADFTNLQSEIEMLNKSDADWLHLDIMDGVFVPNITFGMPVIKQMRKHSDKIFDVHLMIVNPDRFVEDFAKAGADILVVHYEACTHLHRTIQLIKQHGMKAGVSLNPHTPVSVLSEVLADLDVVLIMSVNPGFGGQKFIENTYSKIKELAELKKVKGSNAIIEIDGGVNTEILPKLEKAGAQAFVAGSFVFNSSNPIETITDLKNC